MLHKLAVKISDYFKKMNVLKVDQEIYTYGIELILGDILNLFILFMLACVLNRILEAAIWSVVFLVSRRYTGGFHAPSHWLCILTTQIGFVLSYFLCEYLNSAAYVIIQIAIIGLGFPILMMIGPIGSPKKPVTQTFYRKKKSALTVYTILITAVFLLTIFFLPNNKALLYAFSAYLVVILLVPAGYIDNKLSCGIGSGVVTQNE